MFRAAGVLAVTLCMIAVLYAVPAGATPPEGVSGEILSKITADHPLELKVDGVNFEPETAFVILTRRITMQPGCNGGWHKHSGPVVVSVISGVYTVYNAEDPQREPEVLEPGMGWIAPGTGVHVPANHGGEPLVFIAVIIVPEGKPVKIDQPHPEHCPKF